MPVAIRSMLRSLTVTTIALGSVTAFAQAPSVTSVSPLAVAPGQATKLTVNGANLKGATGLRTTFPAQAALAADVKDNGSNPAQVVFTVTVPADAGEGIQGLRVVAPSGVSSSKLMLVDRLPSVAQAANGTLAMAQPVTLPIAVDGAVNSLGRHYFKFTAAAGQKVSFEVVARRIGSALDPIIRLMDAQGRELVYSDDTPGLMGDCQLSHTFAAPGEYVLELRDIRYQGGGNFIFRLRMGDFPLLNVPYPLAIKRGAESKLEVAGPDLEGVQPVMVKAPTEPHARATSVGLKRAGGTASGFVSVAVLDADQALEVEPNDQPAQATRVALGAGINGRFEKPGDVDRFIFAAKANEKRTFHAVTRQQGSPADLTLKILKPDGGVLVEGEDTGTEDAIVNAAFPADGDYTLVVEDLLKRGGSSYAYRVDVAPTPLAGFALSVGSDAINIPAGGTSQFPVTVVRSGYTGPIQVAAVDLPKGVTSVPTTLGQNLTTAILTVRAAADAPAGLAFPIRVVGTAKVGEAVAESVASASTAVKTANSAMAFAPIVVSEDLVLAVGPAAPVALSLSAPELILGQNLSATIKVTVAREAMYDEEIALAVAQVGTPPQTGLPPGLTAAVKPIPKGANEVEIVFTATPQTPVAEFTAVLQGTLKKGNVTHVQPAPGLTLKVQAPMTVTATPEAPKVAKGGQLKVKVAVQRNPAFKGPVTLTFQNLPKGVTAGPAMLTPEQSEIEATLTVAADAAVGAAQNVTVKADGQGNGNAALSVTSAAVAFTVE